ncbi:MAG: hypothetical protein H5T59_14890, partial [Anaerolineae bacterium]|nr:hypothetical protein [Anaerolineae bacterium]
QVRDLVALARAERQEEVVARLWEVVGNSARAPSRGSIPLSAAPREGAGPRLGEARA